MVEVFKTNVHQKRQAKQVEKHLALEFPQHAINFDLEDCDRILRVEGAHIVPTQIIEALNQKGHECAVLD